MRTQSFIALAAALAAAISLAGCDRAGAAVQPAQPAAHSAGFTVSADNAGSGHSVSFVFNGAEVISGTCQVSADGLSANCEEVAVFQGGTPSAPSTFLFYDLFNCTFDPINYWYTCNDTAVGFGLIPNGDLSGGAGEMRLSTNTASDPSFTTYVGSPGVLDVTWHKTNLYSNSGQGTNKQSYGTFSIDQNSQGSSTSATAVGSILGAPISDSYALIESGHGNTTFHTSH